MTTKIFLVRHAEAEGNLFRVAHGQYDSNLTPRGYRQLHYLRERFRGEKLDAVYGSDLTRTHATASALYVPRGLDFRPEPRLREVRLGDWEERTWAEISRADRRMYEDFNKRHHLWRVEGAETFAQVRDRMVASVAQIDFDAIKRRTLTESDWAGLAAKSTDMSKRDLTVLRAAGMTVADIQSASQAYGFQVVVIDYVQLITPEVSRRAPRSEQMADVSRALHTFAQSSGTLVIELAQLTRQERGSWREPDMHDLKESGQFEQDADIIFLLYRPSPSDDTLDQEKNRILKIAKYKEGPRGRWPLYFDGPKQTFSVMTDADGKAVLRQLVNAGKKAKSKNKAEAQGQQTMSEFRELSAEEAGDIPF